MRWGLCFMRRVRGILSVEAAREIVEKLPESVEKVGVFVNELPTAECFRNAGLTDRRINCGADSLAGPDLAFWQTLGAAASILSACQCQMIREEIDAPTSSWQ